MVNIVALLKYNNWRKQFNDSIVVSSKTRYTIGVYTVIHFWKYADMTFMNSLISDLIQ